MPTANTTAVSSTFLIDPNALWHALTGLTPPLVIDARVLAVEPSQIALVADRFGALPLPPPPAVLALLTPVPPVLSCLIDEFMAPDAQLGRIFAGLRALHPTWEGYLSAAMPVLDALTASVAA